MALKKVILANDVYYSCLQHALTTEKEEVMGLLIGEVDENDLISYITACVILHRLDKQPDRVEISPEQLCLASTYAEELANKLKRPMRVLGWYHSHPHITVWPSHVDVRTQALNQTMDPFFIGLIFSVYQEDSAAAGNTIQLTCFQAQLSGSDVQRKEIKLVLDNAPLQNYNLKGIANLPKILSQEEDIQTQDDESNDDIIAVLHNNAIKTTALAHIVSKVSRPLCDNLESRLQETNMRIKLLENLKSQLLTTLDLKNL